MDAPFILGALVSFLVAQLAVILTGYHVIMYIHGLTLLILVVYATYRSSCGCGEMVFDAISLTYKPRPCNNPTLIYSAIIVVSIIIMIIVSILYMPHSLFTEEPVYKSSMNDRQRTNPLIATYIDIESETVEKHWVSKYPELDFVVYTYGAMPDTQEFIQMKQHWAKYTNVTLIPNIESGCKLAFNKHAMDYFLKNNSYTHLWFIDNDLSTDEFDMKKILSDLREYAPLLSQPAILPVNVSEGGTGRSSDQYWLRAPSNYKNINKPRSLGHFDTNTTVRHDKPPYSRVAQRIYTRVVLNKKPVEIMTPIIDRILVNSIATVCREFDGRSAWAFEFAMAISSELAEKIILDHTGVKRNARLVYDGNPLIHLDTRTMNGSKSLCKRRLLNSITEKEVNILQEVLESDIKTADSSRYNTHVTNSYNIIKDPLTSSTITTN